jgi:molybdopterin converting factor small subunit
MGAAGFLGVGNRKRLTVKVMHVEFFGLPRERAGMSEIELRADTLGQLLGILAKQIPPLSGFIGGDRLHPTFVANLNGNQFVSDPETPLRENDHLIILSADAGG